MPDEELDEERELIRKKWLSEGSPGLEQRMHLIDKIQVDRMNEKYRKEHPNAKPRQKEHGWYLPEDDD